MKYVIGSVVIVAFAAGAYAALRLLAFKEALDAFGRDLAYGERSEKNAEKRTDGRDSHLS